MSDIVPVGERVLPSLAVAPALPAETPSLAELVAFAEEAERRFSTLRMTIVERRRSASGEDVVRHEVVVSHPGRARVNRHHDEAALSRAYDVWVSDGQVVRTYAAADRRATVRRPMSAPVGSGRADLPERGRLRPPLTALPPHSLADTFVHPRGLLRDVMATGTLSLLGTASVAGRESFVLRSEHPRATQALTDRPDRQVEVALDRATGLVLLLVERIGDLVTRHAEVASLDVDPAVPDEAFALHLGPDVRLIY